MAVKLYDPQATVESNGKTHTTDAYRISPNGMLELANYPSEDGKRVSEAEYWDNYYERSDFHYEWKRGILQVKPMPIYRDALLYRWFMILLDAFLQTHPIARLLHLEIGFRLQLGADDEDASIRKPDLFIIRNDNPVLLADRDRNFKGIADLCIEAVSDSTRAEVERDTVEKKAEYALVGVREYFLLDPDGDHMGFFRLGDDGRFTPLQPDAAGVIHSEVLPGFRFRLAHLYSRPLLITLADDPVYQDYVMLEYQAEREHAEQERQRADHEHQRAERLAAQLRALGVDPAEL